MFSSSVLKLSISNSENLQLAMGAAVPISGMKAEPKRVPVTTMAEEDIARRLLLGFFSTGVDSNSILAILVIEKAYSRLVRNLLEYEHFFGF